MKIVQINQIPIETQNVPLNNLPELFSKAQQMEEICRANNGIGLAAAQVGLPLKFFIYSDDMGNFHYMIDCEYTPITQDKYLSIEGCLSIRSDSGSPRHFKVMRYDSISVIGKELVVGDRLEIKDFHKKISKGLECAVFQHEIDHQNNILISSLGEEIFVKKVK